MIKNVVFDIGRVLLDYQPVKFLQNIGLKMEEGRYLNEIIFKNDIWLQLDRGMITLDEAIEAYTVLAPLHKERISQIMHTWPQMLTLIEGTSELLSELTAKGYAVYLLSNFQEDGFKQIYDKYSFVKEAHGSVISYEVMLLKPEKEIYLHLLEKYKLMPEETVFIDDMKENVDAAKALGIQGIIFESAQKTRSVLGTMGIEGL
jgi:putative hydrolase of the HAD superfamily